MPFTWMEFDIFERPQSKEKTNWHFFDGNSNKKQKKKYSLD